MSTLQPNSSFGDAPLKTGSSFSRPAALIGGATALVALTAIATTLAVRSPAPLSDSNGASGAAAAAVAAQSLNTPAKVAGKVGDEPTAADTGKPAPVQANAKPAQQQHSAAQAAAAQPKEQHVAAVCATCGTIESVTAFQKKGEGTGVGAVGGAVVGGLLGHQVGGGGGKNAMTVLGAIGGGVAGNEIEKRHRATTLYSVKVRMDDGSLRTLTQSSAPTVGQKVTVEGSQVKARA
jgi:outer membrane lipoprotein SlyB